MLKALIPLSLALSILPATSAATVIGDLNDPEQSQVEAHLDILTASIRQYRDQLTLSIETRGPVPATLPDPNDWITYIWLVDTDVNPATGQHHGALGSEFNVRAVVADWGGGFVDVTGTVPGGGTGTVRIEDNTVEITINLAQIGSPPTFHWRCDAFQEIGGAQVAQGETPIASATPLPYDPPEPIIGELLGQWDGGGRGPAEEVALTGGGLALLAEGRHLKTISIVDQYDPQPLGRLALPEIRSVATNGSHAFVAAGTTGVVLVDLTDPTMLSEVSRYATTGRADTVVMMGSQLVVLEHSDDLGELARLIVLDVADPADPRVLGDYVKRGLFHAVTTWNDQNAIVLRQPPNQSFNYELCKVDFGNPAIPVETCGYRHQFPPFSLSAADLATMGEHVLAAVAFYDEIGLARSEVHVVDLSVEPAFGRTGFYTTTGYLTGIDVNGSVAHIVGDIGLRLIDLTDPATPTETGGYPGGFGDVAAAEDLAFVAGYYEGLQVVDTSDRSGPVESGWVDMGWAGSLALAGEYVYAMDQGFLRIFGLSDPQAPQEVHVYETAGWLMDVAGRYAYVTDGTALARLDVGDVTQPSAPSPAGAFVAPSNILGLAASEGFAAIQATGFGVRVIDSSDVGGLTEIGAFEPSGPVYGIAAAGEHIYVEHEDAAGQSFLSILHVSGSSVLSTVGVLETDATTRTLVVEADLLYRSPHPTLRIVDVSNPADPYEVGALDVVGGSVFDVHEGYAYLRGLRVVDVSEPAAPVEIGGYGGPWQSDAVVAGTHVYAACGTYGIQIVDVSDPFGPLAMAGYKTPGASQKVAVYGNHAYVDDDDLRIIDAVAPDGPSEVGHYEDARHPEIIDDQMYVRVGDELRILSLLDPTEPSLVGSYGVNGLGRFAVTPERAYAVVWDGSTSSLHVVDTSNAESPERLTTYPLQTWLADLTAAGSVVYLLEYAGLRILDLTDPAQPTETWFALPEGAEHIAVEGGRAYVACQAFPPELLIIDVSAPEMPVELGRMPLFLPEGIAVAEEYVYIADYIQGIRLVDVSVPEYPTEVGYFDPGRWDALDVTVVNGTTYVAWGIEGLAVLQFDLDPDGDTVLTNHDNCPGILNPEQEDQDADAVGDVCDNCLAAFNPDQANADADPLGDACDNCVANSNADQANADADPFGAACDCDDLQPTIHPGAQEINDGLDNQCPGDRGYGLIDEATGQGGFDNAVDYSWHAQPGAALYEVVRSLSPGFGQSCAAFVTDETLWSDHALPDVAETFYYLNRPLTPFAGSWGRGADGAERAVSCRPGVLANGGFENWDTPTTPTAWVGSTAGGTLQFNETTQHSGLRSAELVRSGGGALYVTQLVTGMEPGATYVLEFFAKASAPIDGYVAAAIENSTRSRYLAQDGAWRDSWVRAIRAGVTETWQRYSAVFVFDESFAASDNVRVSLRHEDQDDIGAAIYLDDASISRVTE